MPILSNLIVRIGASTSDFDKQVDRSLSKVKRFASDVTAAGSALAIGFSAPLIAAGAAAIKAGSDMESLTMGLKAVMKSSEATAAEMAKLREVAKLPGLGLEEAVKGSIRLQILGNSADESRRIMSELGNALAVVGGGREDFNEVIRQLSQLGAVGKVTKENLDPIIERIPQLAAIIKEKFGAEALGDPAKTFERMGISSQQFIAIITDELAKGERAGNTYKNSWENIQMAAKDAAAEFGKTLLPIAQRVLDDFLTPGIEKAKAMAEAFRSLPQPTQDWSIALGAVATALPIVIVALGTLAEKAAVLAAAANKAIPFIKGMAGGISVVGTASVAAGAAVAYFMNLLISNRQGAVDTTAESIKKLNANFNATPVSVGAARDTVMAYMQLLKPTEAAVVSTGEAHAVAAKKVSDHTDKTKKFQESLDALAKTTIASSAEKKVWNMVVDDFNQKADKAAKIMFEYGTANIDTAIALARAADEQFRLNRALEEAPDISTRLPFKDIPKAHTPTFTGDFREFERSGANIGPEGMLTKEQANAIEERYKRTGRAGSEATRQVSLALNDLGKGLNDVIWNSRKWGDVMTGVAKQAGQSLTRYVIDMGIKKVSESLLNLGGVAAKVFGGGSQGGGIFSAVGGGGPVLGAGSSGGAMAGGVLGGLTGTISAVSGIASAVSGIIGNFQNAKLEGTMNQVERNTAAASIHLRYLLEKNNEFLPKLKDIWDSMIRMESRQMSVAGGGGVVINVYGGDSNKTLDDITRLLKQYGVIPK